MIIVDIVWINKEDHSGFGSMVAQKMADYFRSPYGFRTLSYKADIKKERWLDPDYHTKGMQEPRCTLWYKGDKPDNHLEISEKLKDIVNKLFFWDVIMV